MAEISKIKMPNNQSYDLKDAAAREEIENLIVVSTTQPSSADNKIWINDEASGSVQVPTVSEMNSALAGKVDDVQVNGDSIVSNGVANIPIATSYVPGIAKVSSTFGLTIDSSNRITVNKATSAQIKPGNNLYAPIVPSNQHESSFYGLAKAAGDTTQAASDNAVGTYTTQAKAAIQTMLDVPSNSSVTSQISTAIGNVHQFELSIQQSLPTENIDTHTIYLIPKTGETNDVYDEYVYINNAWEMIGNTQIDLSNYVQKDWYADTTKAGLVKVGSSSGFATSADGSLFIAGATENIIKPGTNARNPIAPKYQHTSTFYGLAKAAGDTTQSESNNAVGTYTTEAKAAIQQMLGVPSNNDVPIERGVGKASAKLKDFTNIIGANEYQYTNAANGIASFAFGFSNIANGNGSAAFGFGNTTNGDGALVIGNNSVAEGSYAFATGQNVQALGSVSQAEGLGTIANGSFSHVFGKNNIVDTYDNWEEWTANKSYVKDDKVKITVVENEKTTITGYICKTANSDASFTASKWTNTIRAMNYVEIIGNGISSSSRSNAYALEWNGTGHYGGNIYIGCNNDSTGGSKVLCEADFATTQDIQAIISGGAGA